MEFIEKMKERARREKKTIVLPETEDIRTLEAAARILQENVANLVLIGEKEEIISKAKGFDLTGALFVNPKDSDKLESYIELLVELRKSKGLTEEVARKTLIEDALYFGVMMVKTGDADGMVAGACNSTANVLRPSLQILKTAPDTKLVSSFFVMVVPNCEYGEKGTFVFSDCGLCQNPSSEELSAIAGSSAKSFEALVQAEAKVAMLSHSTMGSAKHDDVTKVTEAVAIAKKSYPGVKIDGEFQLDAAIVPSVGASKAPGNDIAGQANVLVFPDLDAGNIGYKLTERLAKAKAYGPITQGIARPVNDLSRGCTAEDIVGVISITAVQAQ